MSARIRTAFIALVALTACNNGVDNGNPCAAGQLGSVYSTPFLVDPGGGWYDPGPDPSSDPSLDPGAGAGDGAGGDNGSQDGSGSDGSSGSGDGSGGDGSGGDGSGGAGADALVRPKIATSPAGTSMPSASGCYACTMVCTLDAPSGEGLTAGEAAGYSADSASRACEDAIGSLRQWARADVHRRLAACKPSVDASSTTPQAPPRVPATVTVQSSARATASRH